MDIASLLLTESEEQSANLPSWNFESSVNPPITPSEIPQLPSDIIYQILRNFQYCRSSLNKFLQINRTWCHISLIFLWSCPFDVSLKAKNSVLLIQTLLSFLSEQEKSELKLNLSCYELSSENSITYNYLEYIRVFDLKHFRLSILHWISYLRNNKNEDFFSDSLVVELNKIYNDIPINYSTVNLASEIISNMLFKKCGDNGLQHLIIEYDDIVTSNYVISRNIIHLHNDLSQLVNFDFHYKFERNFDKNLLINRIVEMFENMKGFVKNLRWLEVNIEHEEHRIPKVGKALVEFIEEQKNLEVLGINEFWTYEENEIYKRICKSQQKSLKHVRFYEMCNFKELLKGLSECNNLVTLEFLGLSKYNSNIILLKDELERKELSIKNFYTCEAITFDTPEITKYFIQIIKMSNKNLETLTLTHITPDIIETLVRFCPNITHLSLFFTRHFDLIPDLLSVLLPPLPLEQFYLKIHNENSESTIYTQDYWNKIAISIPNSIIHLGIDFKIEKNMLDMFLKECKAKLRTISLFQRYMLNRHYLQIIVQYAKKNNNLLKELKFLWDPKESGFISNSNLEDAKKYIKVISKVDPFNKPFYDIKLNIPHKKDQLLMSSFSCKKET
ncbi:hypothetical protein C1645_876158 [Glomus cerebriforme]|uniref:F-box domain-containing protein n=1 Tax=Glomus cerebriforme TaxID=658196 RepID=A0A397T585_9GLOM|nr:hypothetical protein C1645_876158 [Glomus cerebriforme]